MKIWHILREENRNVIYHYTNAWAFAKMLQDGQIKLTLATGSDIQAGSHNAQRMYYLSGTRSKIGHYSEVHTGGVGGIVLVLNGDYLRQNQVVRPVDYWGREFRKIQPTRNEMEERIYSRTPTLPLPANSNALILEAHLLIGKDTDERFRAALLQTIVGSKRAGIPLYAYQDSRAWLLQDKRRAMPGPDLVAFIRGYPKQEPYAAPSFRRPSGYGGYVELFQRPITDRERLSKPGMTVLKRVAPWNLANGDAYRSLEADIHGDKSPQSRRYNQLLSFMEFLRQAGYNADYRRFLNDLSQKWYPPEPRKAAVGAADPSMIPS